MALTQDTRIIFIHGLASKPPQADLMRLWKRALIENIRCDSKTLASAMEANDDLFRFAYWANAVPDHIEDSATYTNALEKKVNEVIKLRKKNGNKMHISSAGWIKSKITSFGLGVVDALATALTIKDDVIKENAREVRHYRDDQYVADGIREGLEHELREAWKKDKYVVIISHSMGTFIAYDVLWRFSHRSESAYKKYRKNSVHLLVTMGSPLGDSTLRSFMLIDRWKDMPKAKLKADRKRFYPTNIGQWHNYSAQGDVVSHDATLKDDFFDGLRKHVGGYGSEDLRDYTKLYNPFKTPNDKSNPHKSYGYLIQPKLSQKLRRFFEV